MHSLIVEQDSFGANPSTKDLARHLYTRMNCGKVVIVTNDPARLLPSLCKQWLRLMRKVQKERAGTLNATRIYELREIITKMQTLRLSIQQWPPDAYQPADVCIATIDELLRWAPEPECRTVYVTCGIATEQLYVMTALLTEDSLVAICNLKIG